MQAGPSRVRALSQRTTQHSLFVQTACSSTSTRPSRRSRQPVTGVDLVAPPDPHSNIRPVIYASSSARPKSATSPYSTEEFPSGTVSVRAMSSKDLDDATSQRARDELELSWRLRRERIDATNHRFWSITNTLFDTHLAHRLSLLPPASDPPTEEDLARREKCLEHFYADWHQANRVRQKAWVLEWWRELWGSLKLELRMKLGGRGPR